MRCARAKKWISLDTDGGLNAAQKRALEAHMEACPECRKLRDDFEAISRKAGELQEIFPRGETWFKIVSGLRSQQRKTSRTVRVGPKMRLWSHRIPVWAAGAALFFVVVAAAVIFGPRMGKPNPGSQEYVLSKLGEAERHYLRAIEALWQAVSAQKDEIDPQLYAVFKKNLDIIDQSIFACREAVLSRPDSIDSRNFLLAAYREKRSLLEDMMTAGTSPFEQNDVGLIH